MNDAATQFRTTLQSDARLGSIWFYLGACYAAAGRDQQAAAFWRNLSFDDMMPAEVYRITADLWLSLGDTATAIPPLRDALGHWPEADELRRRLGVAYALAGQPADAVTTLDPYLERTASDHETLLVAMRALYDAHAAGGSVGSPEDDQARASRYAKAYAAAGGPDQALVIFILRLMKVDTVVCYDPSSLYDRNPDHYITARAVESACWMSRSAWDYPEHFKAGLEPHGPVDKYYFARGRSSSIGSSTRPTTSTPRSTRTWRT